MRSGATMRGNRGVGTRVDDFEYDFGEDKGEVFMTAKLSAVKAGVRKFAGTHLGARCGCSSPSCAKPAAPPSENFGLIQDSQQPKAVKKGP